MKDLTMKIVQGENGYPQLVVDLPSLGSFFSNESAVIAPEDVLNLLETVTAYTTKGTDPTALKDWKEWCSQYREDEEECPE